MLTYTIYLVLKMKKKRDIMDFAGSWKMNDKKAEEMDKELKRLWKSWKPKVF